MKVTKSTVIDNIPVKEKMHIGDITIYYDDSDDEFDIYFVKKDKVHFKIHLEASELQGCGYIDTFQVEDLRHELNT